MTTYHAQAHGSLRDADDITDALRSSLRKMFREHVPPRTERTAVEATIVFTDDEGWPHAAFDEGRRWHDKASRRPPTATSDTLAAIAGICAAVNATLSPQQAIDTIQDLLDTP